MYHPPTAVTVPVLDRRAFRCAWSIVLAVIGICPLAVMRLCPETATPITECDCAWSCDCS